MKLQHRYIYVLVQYQYPIFVELYKFIRSAEKYVQSNKYKTFIIYKAQCRKVYIKQSKFVKYFLDI